MVFHLEDVEPRGTDEDTVDVEDLAVALESEIVKSRVFIAQLQCTNMVPENPFSLHAAPKRGTGETSFSHEAADDKCACAQNVEERGACHKASY